MIKAASLEIAVNLHSFSTQLRELGLYHRIIEESGQQAIYVKSDSDADLLREALARWQALSPEAQANLTAKVAASKNTATNSGLPLRLIHSMLAAVWGSPITWLLIGACAVVAFISSLGADTYPVRNLFYPLLPSESLSDLLLAIDRPIEVIRSLTPMFLHFGELHFVFNMLWLWYFGKQLEALQSTWMFVGLVVVTAFVSNTTQYLAQSYNNFGGMSGVVYGLVGYTWVIHYFMPRSYLLINSRMFVFFVVALVLMEIFASSLIATAAHVGGLVSGLAVGLLVVVYYRKVLKQDVVGSAPASSGKFG